MSLNINSTSVKPVEPDMVVFNQSTLVDSLLRSSLIDCISCLVFSVNWQIASVTLVISCCNYSLSLSADFCFSAISLAPNSSFVFVFWLWILFRVLKTLANMSCIQADPWLSLSSLVTVKIRGVSPSIIVAESCTSLLVTSNVSFRKWWASIFVCLKLTYFLLTSFVDVYSLACDIHH